MRSIWGLGISYIVMVPPELIMRVVRGRYNTKAIRGLQNSQCLSNCLYICVIICLSYCLFLVSLFLYLSVYLYLFPSESLFVSQILYFSLFSLTLCLPVSISMSFILCLICSHVYLFIFLSIYQFLTYCLCK